MGMDINKNQFGGSGIGPHSPHFTDKVHEKNDEKERKIHTLLALLQAGNNLVVVIEGNKFKFAELKDFENPHTIIILKRDKKNFYTATVSDKGEHKGLPQSSDDSFSKSFIHPDGSPIFIKIELSNGMIHEAAFAEFQEEFEEHHKEIKKSGADGKKRRDPDDDIQSGQQQYGDFQEELAEEHRSDFESDYRKEARQDAVEEILKANEKDRQEIDKLIIEKQNSTEKIHKENQAP